MAAAVRAFQVPLDESVEVGLMIREADARQAREWVQVQEWVHEAAAGGAKVLTGRQRAGSLLQPTVLTDTRPEMRVNCEEIFAPGGVVEAYADFEQAPAQVNDSAYGLQAGVFTRDAGRLFQAYERCATSRNTTFLPGPGAPSPASRVENFNS